MIRSKLIALAAVIASLAAPAAAQAEFGFVPETASVKAINEDGTIDTQAGSHPYAYVVHVDLKTDAEGKGEGGDMRSARADLPPGFFGNPQAVPACPHQEFEGSTPVCSVSTQVGVLRAILSGGTEIKGPIYNVVPARGIAAQFGFVGGATGLISIQYATLKAEDGYRVGIVAPDLPLGVTSVTQTIWGTPADPSHDPERGVSLEGNPSDAAKIPFLTLPAQCQTPLETVLRADSVLAPGVFAEVNVPTVDAGGNPVPMTGCESVPFAPTIANQPTTKLAENGTGLDFELALPNQGLTDDKAIAAETQPEKVEVTLPEGVTLNPSAAEGIGVCTQAQYKAEQVNSGPGEGCPAASKVGSIVAHSPLLVEPIEGSLYLAKPYENPSGTLVALYIVARAAERGVIVKQAGRVEPDPKTGQLITTFEDLPPLPYSDFKLHFREGGRATLVSPPACGDFQTVAKLTPFSAPNHPYTTTADFKIERGVDGGACPAGGTPPFTPGFQAGTLSNAAGRHSPLQMQVTRKDGDQDLTKFSTTLPPGLLASLAGVGKCSEAQIAQAASRTGPHGGTEELANPSCPASSVIGHTDTGAGVGSVLLYVPGTVYLAGPYHGAPLSVVAVVPGVAGPFDVGTIVVRVALKFNPRTAEAEVDGSASDPIPHILKGIPLKVRDIRVHIDRPNWTFNPSSCEELSTKALAWGGGSDVFNVLDDSPFALSARFQAADCANLGFKPRLGLKLKGGTKRGGHPALTGTYRPRKGDANLKGLVLRLPSSAFLDQAHIRTICTRVQYAANGGSGGGCPAGSVYGKAKAFTPLLEEPLEGPVYLRSSNNKLPDFVASLRGLVDVEAVARIDSKNGGIRATFSNLPDAPITKVVVNMQGAKKGLIVNSTNLCAGENRADGRFGAHNGRRQTIKPVVGASCGKARQKRREEH